jgi:hypothetical protein
VHGLLEIHVGGGEMNEMVKRVAEALRSEFEPYRVFDEGEAERLARAAIKAMRVPTEAMWNAPAKANSYVNGVLPTGEEAEAIWQAIVDEALK